MLDHAYTRSGMLDFYCPHLDPDANIVDINDDDELESYMIKYQDEESSEEFTDDWRWKNTPHST